MLERKAGGTDVDRAFWHSTVSCLMAILLCMACLSAATFAWFTRSISSGISQAQGAGSQVELALFKQGEDGPLDPQADGSYSLLSGETYFVRLAVTGSASTAYCVVTVNGISYYTEQIATGSVMGFFLNFSEPATVTVQPRWGTSSREARELKNGLSYQNMQPIVSP